MKSFLIPKYVHICTLLPTPKEVVKQLNQIIFKFLWKGTDKVTRVSTIMNIRRVTQITTLRWLFLHEL